MLLHLKIVLKRDLKLPDGCSDHDILITLRFLLQICLTFFIVDIFLFFLQKPSEYLYDNTVRMRDIELLTGMEFFTDRSVWSDMEAIQLRTLLPERKRSSS